MNVELFDILRDIVGERSVVVEVGEATLESVLEKLCQTYGDRLREQLYHPKTGGLLPSVLFILNGKVLGNGLRPGILVTPANDSDTLSIIHALSGG